MDDIKTGRITRDQIAATFGGNQRLIKLFEALLSDVGATLPGGVDAATTLATEAAATAENAETLAIAAAADAANALTVADAAQVTATAAALDASNAQTSADAAQLAADGAQATADGAAIDAAAAQANADALEAPVYVLATADALLPNALVLTAGINTTLDTSTPGQIKVNSSGGGGGGGGGNVTPDTHPTTANVADDEFEYGSSIDTAGGRGTGAIAWSWLNQGTATAGVADGALVLAAPASASQSLRTVIQTASGSAWKYRVKLLDQYSSNAAANAFHTGLCVYNSANGRLISIGVGQQTGLKLSVFRWNSTTSFASTAFNSDIYTGSSNYRNAHGGIYLEIELSGTNLIFKYSDSGVANTFITVYTEALATHILAVDGAGLTATNNNNATMFGCFDWFRLIP